MAGNRPAHETHAQSAHAQHAAATATEEQRLFVATRKCRVTSIEGISDIAVTGDNTNTTNLDVVNKGAAGAGTTVVASLALPTGVNLVAFQKFALALVGAAIIAAGGIDLNEGDVLTIKYTKVGTGVAVGPCLWQVDYVPV
jgi:hypothetical protein